MLVPPFDECGIVCRGMADLPIYLRHTIVHPAVVDPKNNIGIKVVIILQTLGSRTICRVG